MGRSRRKWESPRPQVGVGVRRVCDIFFCRQHKDRRTDGIEGIGLEGVGWIGVGKGE